VASLNTTRALGSPPEAQSSMLKITFTRSVVDPNSFFQIRILRTDILTRQFSKDCLSLRLYVFQNLYNRKKVCYGKSIHFVLLQVFTLWYFLEFIVENYDFLELFLFYSSTRYLDPNPNFFFGFGSG
jgi:hypothetical protein